MYQFNQRNNLTRFLNIYDLQEATGQAKYRNYFCIGEIDLLSFVGITDPWEISIYAHKTVENIYLVFFKNAVRINNITLWGSTERISINKKIPNNFMKVDIRQQSPNGTHKVQAEMLGNNNIVPNCASHSPQVLVEFAYKYMTYPIDSWEEDCKGLPQHQGTHSMVCFPREHIVQQTVQYDNTQYAELSAIEIDFSEIPFMEQNMSEWESYESRNIRENQSFLCGSYTMASQMELVDSWRWELEAMDLLDSLVIVADQLWQDMQ